MLVLPTAVNKIYDSKSSLYWHNLRAKLIKIGPGYEAETCGQTQTALYALTSCTRCTELINTRGCHPTLFSDRKELLCYPLFESDLKQAAKENIWTKGKPRKS
jgi:hypothetical protein